MLWISDLDLFFCFCFFYSTFDHYTKILLVFGDVNFLFTFTQVSSQTLTKLYAKEKVEREREIQLYAKVQKAALSLLSSCMKQRALNKPIQGLRTMKRMLNTFRCSEEFSPLVNTIVLKPTNDYATTY